MTAMVQVEGVHWRYPRFSGLEDDRWTLKGINLEITRGEFLGITGPSGAGKTTTCKVILGLIPHSLKIPFHAYHDYWRGNVWLDGELVTGLALEGTDREGQPWRRLLGRGIVTVKAGMVLQDPETQFLTMSLLREVSLGLQLMGLPRDEIERRVGEALEMVGLGFLIDDAEYIHPNDLSDGQKQRVAIASFLAMRPELLILDEPTSDLDPRGKSEVIETVRMLQDRHAMTVILVEQDPAILHRFCDRIVLMDHGEVKQIEPASHFYRRMDVLEESGIHRFEVSEIAARSGFSYQGQVPISIEEGLECFPKDLDCSLQPPDPQPEGEVVLQVKDLEYVYEDGTQALWGVNFEVHRGEVLALLGINGSGKTTVAKILNGILKPTAGTVRVLGMDVSKPAVRRRLPRYVGYVFQNPDHQIFTRRVWDEVAYGLKNLDIPERERKERITQALEAVGLVEQAEEDPLFLGKGQRQRLAVASILAMHPEIIIVDEPTTGQDYRMVCGIMKLLEELHQQGKTVLIITHDMTLVANYCRRVVVLRNGRDLFTGTPRELFSSPEYLHATQLSAPGAMSLSLAMREYNPGFPLLLNIREWVQALGQYRTGQGLP